MMDWDIVKSELRKKLDPAHVRPAPRGKYGDYVDGYHVISEANRIFGEDGWSYQVTDLRQVSEQTVAMKGNDGPYEQYRVGYLCRVKVTVDGVTREGAAVGSGVGNPNAMADHHESAVKEAETDALKRALRTFGNTFGLALYDKTKAQVGVDRDPRAIADALISAIRKRANAADLRHLAMAPSYQDPINWLKETQPKMAAEVEVTMENRRLDLDPALQAPPVDPDTSDRGDGASHQYQ